MIRYTPKIIIIVASIADTIAKNVIPVNLSMRVRVWVENLRGYTHKPQALKINVVACQGFPVNLVMCYMAAASHGL